MADQTNKQIKYYFKEDTNQILVSGSDTVAKTNAILELVKDPVTQANSFYDTKIVNYGVDATYVVQNGPEFVSLIENQAISNFSSVSVDNQLQSSPSIPVTGNINGTGATLTIKSTPSLNLGVYDITLVRVNATGSNWTSGETITIPQSTLISAGFQNPTADLVVTLSTNNVNIYSTEIPLKSDQELWVHKGYNTIGGDGDEYRYNPHLHRAYKAYIVVETGSGIPSNPWLPVGNPINTGLFSGGGNIPGVYLEKQLAILGNESGLSPNNITGSFQIYNPSRSIRPFIFTKYTSLQTPPMYGAWFRIYLENQEQLYTNFSFNTSTTPPPGLNKISFDTADVTLATEIYIDNYSPNDIDIFMSPLSSSYSFGKTGGKLKISSNNTNYTQYDIISIDAIGNDYFKVNVTYDEQSSPFTPFTNAAAIDTLFSEVPDYKGQFSQFQYGGAPSQPELPPIGFRAPGFYTYTSSVFPVVDGNNVPAVGSTQFGLYADYSYYMIYNARVDALNTGTVRVTFTSSANIPSYVDIPAGYNANIPALVGTLSQTGFTPGPNDPPDFSIDSTYFGENFTVTINGAAQGTPPIPPDNFAKRWESAYISYSSSLSSSLDGLYVFNQLPQNDVQVTASMFITAWTGSAAGTTYGDTNSEYGTATYDVGEAGDGPTWPTASIRIYTGSYPTFVPTTLDAFVTQSEFRDENIHVNGLAITMSYLIPSQSIGIKDCLSLSLAVSSGSAPSESVENSLVVREYYLEFNTPQGEVIGDGIVPTFIQNAFNGTQGFNNAPDCQPLLNNAIEGRENKRIQEVDYSTGIYDPINFQAILSGSAQKSTVPESNYTQLASINPRYNGSRSNNSQINIWSAGDTGTYGKTPSVALQDAYFGYFNDLDDPYPNINGLTRVNLSYLIDEAGNALPPSLDNQLTIDTFDAVFPNTTVGKLAVRDINSKYQDLGSPAPISRTMEYVTPICYSQNSGENYSNTIPLSGSGFISRYDGDDSSPASVTFAQFSAAGTCSVDTTSPTVTIAYWLNPSEVISQPSVFPTLPQSGYALPYLISGSDQGVVRYPTADWGSAGSDLNNQQIVSMQTSIVTTYVSETERTGEELKIHIEMWYGNLGTSGTKRPFNLEYIHCKVYTETGQVQLIKNVDKYGWFHYANVANPRALGPEYNINNDKFTTSRIGVPNEGLICTVDWEMYETLYSLGLMRERAPRNGSGVIALEWIYSVNSGPQSITAGNEIKWYVKGQWKFRRPGWVQGQFFPNGYSGAYTPTQIQGLGVKDHLLGEANKAVAPFWQFSGSDHDFIQMASLNFNEAYGSGFYQGDLPYIPGTSQYFPGNVEPKTTAFDPIENPIEFQENDEIRFGNNENFTYRILEVFTPGENNGKVKLRLDKEIDTQINKDFFLIRRKIANPNSLYLNTAFPYGKLASGSISQVIVNTGSNDFALTGSMDGSGNYTGSISNLEIASTPGILFPDFPTEYLINSASIIVNDLITRRIIQS